MESFFSVFRKNITENNTIKQFGGARNDDKYTRDFLLEKFLNYYDTNKKYSTPKKKIEAIMKDMKYLKNEKSRIYIDDNGEVDISFDNLFISLYL